MAHEIVVIGEEVLQEEFTGFENLVSRGNLTLFSFKNSTLQHLFYNDIKRLGKYEVLKLDEYEKIISRTQKEYKPLENFTFKDCIEWQFKGNENFIVSNDNTLSNWNLRYDDVEKITDTPVKGSIQVSNTGIFLANYHSNKLVLYIEKLDKIFNDMFFESDILNLQFNNKDEYLLVFTKQKTYLVDIYQGDVMKEFEGSNFVFDMSGKNIFEINNNVKFNIETLSDIKFEEEFNLKVMKTKYNQTMGFSDEKVQKILYYSNLGLQRKTLANVLNVDFFFSKNRGYALITKSIKGGKSFSLETYSYDTITINAIEAEVKKIEVSDNGFITYDINKNVIMYRFDKFSFRKVKQVQKEDDVVISISDKMFCVYDGETENIEFYDEGELRSVYSHQACTNIIWAESGLYCASISRSTGLTQLYNNNGKLFWKRIYNRITNFVWRPYFELSSEEKECLSKYNLSEYEKPFETSIGTVSNLDELISEWKSFLIGKKQLISEYN